MNFEKQALKYSEHEALMCYTKIAALVFSLGLS